MKKNAEVSLSKLNMIRAPHVNILFIKYLCIYELKARLLFKFYIGITNITNGISNYYVNNPWWILIIYSKKKQSNTFWFWVVWQLLCDCNSWPVHGLFLYWSRYITSDISLSLWSSDKGIPSLFQCPNASNFAFSITFYIIVRSDKIKFFGHLN